MSKWLWHLFISRTSLFIQRPNSILTLDDNEINSVQNVSLPTHFWGELHFRLSSRLSLVRKKIGLQWISVDHMIHSCSFVKAIAWSLVLTVRASDLYAFSIPTNENINNWKKKITTIKRNIKLMNRTKHNAENTYSKRIMAANTETKPRQSNYKWTQRTKLRRIGIALEIIYKLCVTYKYCSVPLGLTTSHIRSVISFLQTHTHAHTHSQAYTNNNVRFKPKKDAPSHE